MLFVLVRRTKMGMMLMFSKRLKQKHWRRDRLRERTESPMRKPFMSSVIIETQIP